MEPIELEPGFEPQIRARSNTWPLPRPENYIDKDENASGNLINVDPTKVEMMQNSAVVPAAMPIQLPHPISQIQQKKNSSRRNAWGNMSYADLITQAIQSAPEKRLTLSQIYEWMVQNVPYFKDKGDSNSSAGWKNSIRHNLSLHNRFMRVQNEGTGKSSWWMLNPDAKPGKSARRRATSMETSKFEKRRGRVKKKVEALRNGLDATPSPSSSVSEGLDLFPESPVHTGFQYSPEFRPRASSNASSCGRLSPIPAVETDSQIGWSAPENPTGDTVHNGAYLHHERYGPEQLAGNLAEGMKIADPAFLAEVNRQQQHYSNLYGFQNRLPPQTYGVECPIHRNQSCGCSFLERCKQELMPATSYYTNDGLYRVNNGLTSSHHVHHHHHQAPTAQHQKSLHDTTASQMMSQVLGALNHQGGTIMDDLNFNIEPSIELGCNVDEVIKHELSMDGNLEFNFAAAAAAAAQHQPVETNQQTEVFTGHSWVH